VQDFGRKEVNSLGFVPDLHGVGGGCEDGVVSVMIDATGNRAKA
jgi:hypothetical protein